VRAYRTEHPCVASTTSQANCKFAVYGQVQFLSIVGTVGGSQASPANKAFSEGFGMFNFDLMPTLSGGGGKRRSQADAAGDKQETDPYACDPSARDSVIVKFLERAAICFGIVASIFMIRAALRQLQMWW
jgi:hypothetical protein